MAELVMVKRKALPNEIGLFVSAEVFEEAFSTIKMGAEVTVTATTKATQKYNRLSWHIARLVCDASEAFDHPEDARDFLLIECRHYRRRFDKLRDKAEVIPKPTRDLDGTAWIALLRRMGYVATTQFGIPEDAYSRQMREAQPPQREEPPPHDQIPDGPTTPPERPTEPAGEPPAEATKEPEPVGNEPGHAAPEVSDPVSEVSDDDGPGDYEASLATEEPDPPAPTGKKRTKPKAPEPDIGPEPPTPTDIPTYTQFAIWHCEKNWDEASFIVWWNSNEQWNLRQACGVGVIARKDIEARFVDKFPMFGAKKA